MYMLAMLLDPSWKLVRVEMLKVAVVLTEEVSLVLPASVVRLR
jgi:hypothetical protein